MATHKEAPITVRIRLMTNEEQRQQALRTFRSLVGQVRGEPGCLACSLLENVHEPGDLTFVEEWRSLLDMERYVRSTAFGLLLAGIDLAAQEPEVEIQTSEGLHSELGSLT